MSIDSLAPAAPVALVAPTGRRRWHPPAGERPATQRAPTPRRHRAAPRRRRRRQLRTRTLYQVPLTVNVTGSYFELEQFLNKLENLRRSFLVSGFTLGPSASG